ncbi:MAG: hypothetical protein ABII09_08645 [Planctomycetota bacterium]
MKRITMMKHIMPISIVFFLVSGCTNLTDVREELGKGGFALWYPAESGITPGQIWKITGDKKDIIQLKPDSLHTIGPNPAKFETLKKSINANISLEAKFAETILGRAGAVSAEFKRATVKSVTLEFGDTEIERLPVGQLRDGSIPESYRTDLKKVRIALSGYVLLAAVVSTSGMKYVFKCEDATILKAHAPEISKILNANFDLKLVSRSEAVWEIPGSKKLAIGISPMAGQMLDLNDEQIEMTLKSLRFDKDIEHAIFQIDNFELQEDK